MTDDVGDLVREGNPAITLLSELFACDITIAQSQCDTCSTIAPVGSLGLYAAPMGLVLRCRHCESVLMRAVYTPHGRWLDMKGARYLRF